MFQRKTSLISSFKSKIGIVIQAENNKSWYSTWVGRSIKFLRVQSLWWAISGKWLIKEKLKGITIEDRYAELYLEVLQLSKNITSWLYLFKNKKVKDYF